MSQITRRRFLCEALLGGTSAILLMSFGRPLSADNTQDPEDIKLGEGTVLVRNPAYVKKQGRNAMAVLETTDSNGRKTVWGLDDAASFAWDHIVSFDAYNKKQHITIHRLLDLTYQKYPDEAKDKIRNELMAFLNKAVKAGILLVPPVKAKITERAG